MRLFLLILLLTASIIEVKAKQSTESETTSKPRLFLVGGSLKTCSSMALKNCTLERKNKIEQASQQVKTTTKYRLNVLSIKKIMQGWPITLQSTEYDKIQMMLNLISVISKSQTINKQQLKQIITTYDEQRIIDQLDDLQYYYLFDMLEVANTHQGERITEQVYLDDSTNPFAIELYRQFVQYAADISGNKTPNILVVTASARDPFEAVDFYTQVFTQAGGNTKWLPLDGALQATWQNSEDKNCTKLQQMRSKINGNFKREKVYKDHTALQLEVCQNPNMITEMIKNADGIFINGGDQSLTVQAFKTNDGNDLPVLKQIRDKINQGKLIIGGTSAGTAVMSSSPMISNGLSTTAILRGAKADVLPIAGCDKTNSCDKQVHNDDLTYRSSGGLGLFPWGIMDTHFSERGRQGRLATLAKDTNTSFGFGVDETTAMLVSWSNNDNKAIQLKVLGQSGVFIVENKPNNDNQHITHYITRDDEATIKSTKLTIDIANWKNSEPREFNMRSNYANVFKGLRYKTITELLCRSNNKMAQGHDRWQDNKINIQIDKTANSINRQGAIKMDGEIYQYCSYTDYLLNI